MSFLDELRKRLKELEQASKPTSLEYILRKQTGCRRIYIPDRHLNVLRKEDVMTFLWLDKTDKKEYKVEVWDCDDFARELYCRAKNYFWEKYNLNAAFGFLWTIHHAFNFFVDTHRTVQFIEPQTDAFIRLPGRPQFMLI